MLTVRFIRHGESVANAGGVTEEPHSIPLTALGRHQAQALSRSFVRPPDLIIASPYLRARDTAAPTLERFRNIRFEIWPVQEISCLALQRCFNTTTMQRRPWVEAFWEKADPHHRDGHDAETYTEFVARIRFVLAKLTELPPQTVAIFSHGQFMKAVHWEIAQRGPAITPQTMRDFRAFHLAAPIANASGFTAQWNGEGWRLLEMQSFSPHPGPADPNRP